MPNLIVVAAFKRDEEGQLLSAFEPLQMQSEGAALNKARLLSTEYDGVIAWSRAAEPMVGEYGDPVELFRSGDVPDME